MFGKLMTPSSIPETIPNPEDTVEKTANFEGNWSEVLFDRMHNPVIHEQLVNLLYQEQAARQEYYRTEPFVIDFVMANGDKVYKDCAGKQVLESDIISFTPKTKEEIGKELDERLREVMSVTKVEFSDKEPTSESIGLLWGNPYTGEHLSSRQLSLVEAHEKGHILRPFETKFFRDYFASGFDASKIIFTEADMDVLSKEPPKWSLDGVREKTPEEIKKDRLEYLFSGEEIAERMAQLKNYFGMRVDDKFTREHLAYARKNYLKDVGLDNGMTHFFQSITPETEENFLRLMNTSGI